MVLTFPLVLPFHYTILFFPPRYSFNNFLAYFSVASIRGTRSISKNSIPLSFNFTIELIGLFLVYTYLNSRKSALNTLMLKIIYKSFINFSNKGSSTTACNWRTRLKNLLYFILPYGIFFIALKNSN